MPRCLTILGLLLALPIHALAQRITFDVLLDGAPWRQATGAVLARAGLRVALEHEWRAAVIELILRP